jgi:uncharacterized MAPEG superfamily protein
MKIQGQGAGRLGQDGNASRAAAQQNAVEGFPLYASCHLGLIVDGRKGAGPIRAALIRQALRYMEATR